MHRNAAWRAITVVLNACLVVIVARTAVGKGLDPKTTASGPIMRVTTVTNDTEQTVEDAPDWQDIPGASATVSAMTSWGGGLVLARFFSDGIRGCQGSNPCFLRILVDGVEADPAVPAVWNSDSWEPHYIDRTLPVEPAVTPYRCRC
jgi:hypothetical protein